LEKKGGGPGSYVSNARKEKARGIDKQVLNQDQGVGKRRGGRKGKGRPSERVQKRCRLKRENSGRLMKDHLGGGFPAPTEGRRRKITKWKMVQRGRISSEKYV